MVSYPSAGLGSLSLASIPSGGWASVSALFPSPPLGWAGHHWPPYPAVGVALFLHDFLPFHWARVIIIGLSTQKWAGLCPHIVPYPSAELLSFCWVCVIMVGIHTQQRAGGHPHVSHPLSTGLAWSSFASIPSDGHGIIIVCPTPPLGSYCYWHSYPAASWVSSSHVSSHLCWAHVVVDHICTQWRAGCYPCKASSPVTGLASLLFVIRPSSGLGFVLIGHGWGCLVLAQFATSGLDSGVVSGVVGGDKTGKKQGMTQSYPVS